jgi:hypothetical protein
MSNPNANLTVQAGASTAPGWKNVNGNNGQPYSYLYGGGSDGVGGLDTTVGSGTQVMQVKLDTDQQRFQLADIQFFGDTQNQLTWNGTSNKVGTITDQNTQVETASYTVIVTDTQANTTIPCDPMIKNDPSTPPAAQIRHS